MDEPAVELALRLLVRPAFVAAWGGRIRMASTATSPAGRARSVGNVPAYRSSARAFRMLMAARVALLAPMRLSTSTPADWLPRPLAHLTPVDAIVGTPGPYQNVLVRLGDPRRGGFQAIAKVMVSTAPGTQARARTEVEALRDMSVRAIAPEVLAEGAVDGHPYLVMSFVAGRSLRASRSDLERACRALDFHVGCARTVIAQEHPWVKALQARLPGIRLDALPRELGVVRTHGDFAPWNVLLPSNGRPVVIDWEASVAEGVLHTDLAHYVLAVERFIRRRSPGRALSRAVYALGELAHVAPDDARAIVGLAAVAALLRDQPEHLVKEDDGFWRAVVGLSLGNASNR